MPGFTVDGQDVMAMYEAAGAAIERARSGEGPTLLEAKTYRYYGHYSGDPGGYRTEDEINAAKSRDCIERFKRQALNAKLLTEAQLADVGKQVVKQIDDSIEFAKSSPLPALDEVTTDVYVSYP